MASLDEVSSVNSRNGGLLAAIRSLISRDEFFAGLFIVGCANGLGSNIIQSFHSGDWTGGVQNISVIVLFACVAGVSLFLRNKDDELTSGDLATGLIFIAFIVVPVSEINWAAVSGLSLYVLLFANDNAERKRGALILLAVTVPMLWSRLLFSFISQPFLDFDAALAGWILDTHKSATLSIL